MTNSRQSYLSVDDLKGFLHKDIKQLDKILLVLASFEKPTAVIGIQNRAHEAGLRMGANWNISSTLRRSKGLAIQLPLGWELSHDGVEYVRKLGAYKGKGVTSGAASDLREQLDKISNEATRAFVVEAIECLEHGLMRSAIVMSWIAAVDVLHKFVVDNHLDAFNKHADEVVPKWKVAKNADGLGRAGEEQFLNICAAIGCIGKNRKEQLLAGLKLRNGCGHPNSLKVGSSTVSHHIEILLLNVFEPYTV